jgi:magnesium chelatase family protein
VKKKARRFAGHERVRVNAEMGPAEVRRYCEVEPSAQPLLRAAAQRLRLSAPAFHRVLKLADADLAEAEQILRRISPRRCSIACVWMRGKGESL